jgi:hypothetical protein
MGSLDEIFDTVTQVDDFDAQLKKNGARSMSVVIAGKTHAFDMRASIGSQMHLEVIKPGVDWVCQFMKDIQSVASL